MTERATQRCRASLTVGLPTDQALELFTPEGERAWAPGWAPRYCSATADRSAPGTVFTTAHGDDVTTWLVVGREPGRRMQFARMSEWVGTVEVSARLDEAGAAGAAQSIVDVEYALTPVNDHAEERLARFVAHYPAFIAGWSEEIQRCLGTPPGARGSRGTS